MKVSKKGYVLQPLLEFEKVSRLVQGSSQAKVSI